MVDMNVTPSGKWVPFNFFQMTEEERMAHALNQGWFGTFHDYLANRPFALGVHFLSADTPEYRLMWQELVNFYENQPVLEEMLVNVPVRTSNYMCPKRIHKEGLTTMLNFLTSVIYRSEHVKDPNEIDLDGSETPAANAYVSDSGVDDAALQGLKKAA